MFLCTIIILKSVPVDIIRYLDVFLLIINLISLALLETKMSVANGTIFFSICFNA